MKTLLLTPSIALGLGFAGNAIAEVPNANTMETSASVERVIHKTVSLVETGEFYQGDFLLSANESLKGLSQSDLYTGRGASKSNTHRWVTDF